ncbi:MAG TPA: hypothetical protein VFN41_15840 [Candidatus Limnocylindrales bacterium]|nr:hypothetical protein [Candidatus Limnocylindrales bacterium]
MSKVTVTRLFVGALVGGVAGILISVISVLFALADGVIAIGGPTAVTIKGDAFGDLLVWLVIASLLMGAASLAAIASWVGALLNTFRLEDKTWFIAVLVLGLASFGWVAMIAYVIAGPDSTRPGAVLAVSGAPRAAT